MAELENENNAEEEDGEQDFSPSDDEEVARLLEEDGEDDDDDDDDDDDEDEEDDSEDNEDAELVMDNSKLVFFLINLALKYGMPTCFFHSLSDSCLFQCSYFSLIAIVF